jgi:hypothetical protein
LLRALLNLSCLISSGRKERKKASG